MEYKVSLQIWSINSKIISLSNDREDGRENVQQLNSKQNIEDKIADFIKHGVLVEITKEEEECYDGLVNYITFHVSFHIYKFKHFDWLSEIQQFQMFLLWRLQPSNNFKWYTVWRHKHSIVEYFGIRLPIRWWNV